MPSVHQLRTLIEVAKSGSVRAAADRMVVSQPAVSAALTTLAREVGVALFERDGRGTRLTEAGRVMVESARRALALIDDGCSRARRAGEGNDVLSLAAVTTLAEQLLPELLRGFRDENASIDIGLEIGNRGSVWELLDAWEVEVALAGHPPEGHQLRTLATRPNELVIVARPGSGARTLADLAHATWLLREPGSGTRSTTEDFFSTAGIAPMCLTVGSNTAIREGVRCGLGISLLARDAVARELEYGLIEEVSTPLTPLMRPWHAVASIERELSAAATAFVSYLCERGGFVHT